MTLHLTGLRFRHGVPRDTQAVHRTITRHRGIEAGDLPLERRT